MSNEAQDVTVETQNPVTEEVQEEAQAVDNQDQGDNDGSSDVDGVAQEEEQEVDQKELQKTNEALESKVKRQRAAYSDMQRKLEETTQQLQQLQSSAPEAVSAEPLMENYDTLDEFQSARDKFIVAKTEKELEQKSLLKKQQEQAQSMQAERNGIYERSKKATLDKYPNFVRAETEVDDFLISAAKSVPSEILTVIGAQLFDEPDLVGEVVYYFGANNGERIEELVEITKQDPRKAAISLYKLQQKLKGAPQPKRKEPLPQPAKRVSATGSSKKDIMKGDVLKNLGLK